MPKKSTFPHLENWEATKATLHAYSKVIGVVPRTHAIPHPKWWHISLKVIPEGLVTENMPLPDGGIFTLKMNFLLHRIELLTSTGQMTFWNMAGGLTAHQLASQIFAALESLNIKGEYARPKFENDDPREYNPGHAATFFTALVLAERAFSQHRTGVTGETGPVQLWPHGFDLSFEWFGTRQIEYEEHGQISRFPSQINLGFSPGEPSHPKPYFYSNPFPFEAQWLDQPLPHGARWFTESWKGSLLEYELLTDDPDAQQKLLAYARAVYELASPGLIA
jgi:hypothetical protein